MENTERLKSYLKDYCIHNLEQDPKDKTGTKFICPSCGSGKGKSKTPAFSIKADTNKYKCFSCGIAGDIFDLMEYTEHITDKAGQFNKINELYGDNAGSKPFKSPSNTNINKTEGESNQEPNLKPWGIMKYIEQCNKAIKNTSKALEFLKARGIKEETIDKFKLGYDKKNDSLIIPYDNYRYTARPFINKGIKYKMTGNKTPFNIEALEGQKQPIFILESELDVVLIEQLGAKAIGLGGSQNINNLMKQINPENIKAPLILWGDKDQPGEEMEIKLAERLDNINYPYLIVRKEDKREKDITEDYVKAPGETEGVIAKYINEANGVYAEYIAELRKEITKDNTANYIDLMFRGIEERQNIKPIATGFNYFDNVLGGGLYPGLYVIGALSGLGKTTYTLQIADQLSEFNNDVIFFSLEMSREELIAKSLSRLTKQLNRDKHLYKSELGITIGHRYKNYSEQERGAIEQAKSHYKETIGHRLYINEGIGEFGTREIENRIKKHIDITGNNPVVIIDYLQLLTSPFNNSALEKQILDKNILELKRISRKYNIVVWAISSFNRDSYQRKLNTGAFKESGAIEYSSDVVIGLNFLEAEISEPNREGKLQISTGDLYKGTGQGVDNNRKIALKILKNRKGTTGGMIRYDYYPFSNELSEKGEIDHQGNIIRDI